LEYSEILDIVRTCCHIVQTACKGFQIVSTSEIQLRVEQ